MLTRLKNAFAVSSARFSLQDLEGFPYENYEAQLSRYAEAERWYKGDALADQAQPATGKQTDLYPMRINPIKATVAKHAYAMFGEVENDGRPLVVTKMIPPESGTEEDTASWKKATQHGEDVLNLVWWENNGRELMIRNALMSQIYGGCVFKATYVPWEGEEFDGWRQIPIRIEAPNPKTFVAVPDASDLYRLAECWIVREIDEAEALRWGYTPGSGEELWYNEWWGREEYRIRINNTVVVKTVKGERFPLSGPNPFGVVPAVYIPHLRDLDFLGSNAYDHLKGYIRELNLRYGDYGDATNDDAHPIVAVRDVAGSMQMRKVTNWLEVVDLGQTQGITGNEKPPDMFEVRQQRASSAMKDLISAIWEQYMRDSYVPPVAYGEDEGSQRSGMTLAMRFWPLGSHASTERYFWTAGLDVFQPILLRIMRIKAIMEITEKHTRLRMKQVWAPLLPRDREADVQEWAQRAANYIGSPEHLLELAGDVEDIPEERARMLQWVEDLEAAKLAAAHEAEMELQEAQAESDIEQTEIQGENQIEAADVQAKAFASRPQPGGGGAAQKKPVPRRGNSQPKGGAK